MPTLGLGQALTALVGRYIGEGKPELAVQRVYEAFFLAMSYMALMGHVLRPCFESLSWAFFSQDPTVIQVGSSLLICAALLQVFDSMGITFAGALRGAGDTHWDCRFDDYAFGLRLHAAQPGFRALDQSRIPRTVAAGTINVSLFGFGLWWRFSPRPLAGD